MKILLLVNSLSGLFSFRKELLDALQAKGHEVVVSGPDSEDKVKLMAMCIPFIPTKINRRGKNPFSDLRLLSFYFRLLQKLHPDVILTYTVKPNVYGGIASRIMSIPQIANITGLGTAIENPGFLRSILFWMYRLGLKKANHIFFQNEYNRDFCIRHNLISSSISLSVLPGSGVNVERFSAQPYPKDVETIRLLYIGRVMEAKGSRELFKSASDVKKIYPRVEFHIIGNVENDFKQVFESLVKDNLVIFHGEQNDVRPYIVNAHCLIHPSYHEGMSNVILEASAMARPIITTNVPGCREAVKDGVTGLLCEPRNSKDLTDKILHFISLPYHKKVQMGQLAHDKVVHEFNRQIVTQTYLNVISNI